MIILILIQKLIPVTYKYMSDNLEYNLNKNNKYYLNQLYYFLNLSITK